MLYINIRYEIFFLLFILMNDDITLLYISSFLLQQWMTFN